MLIAIIFLWGFLALFFIAVYITTIKFIRPARRPSRLGHVVILTLIIIIACFIAYRAAVEWKARSTESGLTRMCRSNLKAISVALMVYAQDNNGWLPPELITVLLMVYAQDNNGWLPSELMVLESEDRRRRGGFCLLFCPAAHIKDRRAPELEFQYPDKVTPETIDYQYVTGLRRDDPAGTVVCREKNANHKIGRHILYLDGRIEARKP